jgi:predicted AlkP superfamily phosphohydrolase/phosphomutase
VTKKAVLIGLDGLVPSLVERYFNSDNLPNIKKLAMEGARAECIPVFPTNSASNWTSISTGALPRTHGVVDMVVHLPGTPLTEIKSGFYSDLCQAEQIWSTCERVGKKVLLLKYIASWPPNIGKGVQVEGFGAPGGPASRPWGTTPVALSTATCYSSTQLENAKIVSFHEANISNWKNISPTTTIASDLPPLEAEITIGPSNRVRYSVLLFCSSSSNSLNKYDTALLGKNKDATNGIILKKGQLSDWVIEDFETNGITKKGSFRVKLIDIGTGEKNNNIGFKLFISQIFPIEGWTFPKSVALKLINTIGPLLESISHFPYAFGWTDENTYLDDISYQAKWISNATKYLMSQYGWDLYMTHWQATDNTAHGFLRFDKSVLTQQESEIADRVVQRTYEISDELVGNIFRVANDSSKELNSNDEIYTFIVSDHGQVMGKRRFFINAYLYEKGLIKLKRDSATQKISVDWKNTRAFAQGMVHVYVNLKGRDPEGAVNPGNEYDNTVERLIDTLYNVKDPKTGLRPISFALTNKESEFLGLSGERAGDVIFAAHPVYAVDNRIKVSGDLFEDLKVAFRDGSIHGAQLPSVDLGEQGTMKTVFIAHGPNIKKGYIRKKPISVIDIAPTIAHALGIPAPKDSDGNIIYDLFEESSRN